MEAAAMPFPSPDRTPPVTIMYLVGILKIMSNQSERVEIISMMNISIELISQAEKSLHSNFIGNC